MASIGSNILTSRKGWCGDDLHLKVVRVSKSKRRRVSGVAARVWYIVFGGNNSPGRWLRRRAGDLPRQQTINETKDRFIRVMFLQWSCKFRSTRLANGRETTIKSKKRKHINNSNNKKIRRRPFSRHCHRNCNTYGHCVNPLPRALYVIYLFIFFVLFVDPFVLLITLVYIYVRAYKHIYIIYIIHVGRWSFFRVF